MVVDEDIDKKIDMAIKLGESEKDSLEKRKPKPFWNLFKKQDEEEQENIPTFTIMKDPFNSSNMVNEGFVVNEENMQKIENLLDKHKITSMKKSNE